MEDTIEVNDPMLEKLVHYFYKGHLNFSLMAVDIKKMDWHWQDTFLQRTLNSELLKKYPISPQFTKLFLKKLVEYLEPTQEIHDDLYAQLCISMKASSQENFCFKHYVLCKDLDKIITMKETRNMVVNGTTGLKTWEAALMLSDWALCNKEIFLNKNILELGSGVGFAGITIAKMCDVKSLILTDCHAEVLQTICENIQINFSHCTQQTNKTTITLFSDETKSIGAMLLDWNNIEDYKNHSIPDIIIGADIVYDPTILQPLCNVIKKFGEANKYLEVYIASVVRNEETFKTFLYTLDTMCISKEEIEIKTNVFIEWDETMHKCLLKLKFKS